LNVYAEKTLRVLGQKIIVVWKHKNTNRGTEGNDIRVQLLMDDVRTVGGLEPLGKYERLVIRMSLAFLSGRWAF
jgi:hypothetical protein